MSTTIVIVNIVLVLCLAALTAFAFLSKKKKTRVAFSPVVLYLGASGLISGLVLFIFGNRFSPIYLAILTLASVSLAFFSIYKENSAQEAEKAEEQPSAVMPHAAAEPQSVSAAPSAAEAEEDAEMLSFGREFMIAAGEAFSNKDGLAHLLDKINEAAIKVTHADGGAVLLVDEFDDVITVKSFSGIFPPPYQLPQDLPHKPTRVETSFRFAQFPLGETIFGIAAKSGKAELITDPLGDERVVQNEPEEFLRLGSNIVVPMIVKDSVIGVVALSRNAGSPKFSEADFHRAQVITDFASGSVQSVFAYQEIVEHSELTRESAIACKLQKEIHAKLVYTIPGASFGCFFNTAEGVCGDYFDVIPCRKDRIAFVLADVAGKGMNSLIVMVMIRAIMQLIVNTQKTAATILDWTNRGITGKVNIDHFASLVLANYNSENQTIQFSTAGNAPILLYNSETRQTESISMPSDPIGVDKATTYSEKEIAVKSGDIVVLYTDGLVEAVDAKNQQYGIENIKRLVVENAALKAQDISAKIKKDLQAFCGNARQHDDQTLLVIKIN